MCDTQYDKGAPVKKKYRVEADARELTYEDSLTYLPTDLQLRLGLYLFPSEIRILRRASRRISRLPLVQAERPTTCSVCLTHAVPLKHVYLEFYIDTKDDIVVFYTVNLREFLSLPADDQTPRALLAVLERHGFVFGDTPLHACWILTDMLDDVFVSLKPSWGRDALFSAQRCEPNDNGKGLKNAVVVRVAGPVPSYFEQLIQDAEVQQLQHSGIDDADYFATQREFIADSIAYHNDTFYANLMFRSSVYNRFSPRKWTAILRDPDTSSFRKASIRQETLQVQGLGRGVVMCRYDFRNPLSERIALDDVEELDVVDLTSA